MLVPTAASLPWLPVLTIALALAALATALVGRAGLGRGPRLAVAAGIFIAALMPSAATSAAGYLRAIFGEPSITSLALVLLFLGQALGPAAWRARLSERRTEISGGALVLVVVALLFYPLSLGVAWIDPYAYGYYPSVLSASLLALFMMAVFAGWWLIAGLMALAYLGFAGHWLESDNLWDYLFDVPLVLVALFRVMTHRADLTSRTPSWFTPRRITIGAFIIIAAFLIFAIWLAKVNPEDFVERFAVEDGFVEWGTSIALFVAFILSVRRFIRAGGRFELRGKLILLFVAFVCIFGAGEEISWGQRVFGIETPESFKERNAQEEFNLHNLTFEWNGETIKINKLVFGRGLTLALITYLLIMGPLYRRRPGFRAFIDRMAIPIATTPQTIAYIVVVAVVETLIDSPKRGEMTEFAGSIIFLLNIAFPYNRRIYGEGGNEAIGPPGDAGSKRAT